jgi:hypothetical protein
MGSRRRGPLNMVPFSRPHPACPIHGSAPRGPIHCGHLRQSPPMCSFQGIPARGVPPRSYNPRDPLQEVPPRVSNPGFLLQGSLPWGPLKGVPCRWFPQCLAVQGVPYMASPRRSPLFFRLLRGPLYMSSRVGLLHRVLPSGYPRGSPLKRLHSRWPPQGEPHQRFPQFVPSTWSHSGFP